MLTKSRDWLPLEALGWSEHSGILSHACRPIQKPIRYRLEESKHINVFIYVTYAYKTGKINDYTLTQTQSQSHSRVCFLTSIRHECSVVSVCAPGHSAAVARSRGRMTLRAFPVQCATSTSFLLTAAMQPSVLLHSRCVSVGSAPANTSSIQTALRTKDICAPSLKLSTWVFSINATHTAVDWLTSLTLLLLLLILLLLVNASSSSVDAPSEVVTSDAAINTCWPLCNSFSNWSRCSQSALSETAFSSSSISVLVYLASFQQHGTAQHSGFDTVLTNR
jgi:hypothetical protein